ncbi:MULTISPECIES: TrkH family potassium uptake protein [Pontibacter]|uniref:Potassium uptake protein, TrkH family n=1 Tax=Pontibacter lucknowensis TaxID=1077936 RepID=A0A1N6YA32_9BACT|nr:MULTISPECIES: potassium transporter TrkG [Pontibacter]EJF08055.1 h(+)-transporting two-sector atpase [Pontibacter sp. BAB1700]SIR11438.1 potassium uptake protein, TrkH family [Pontibacter lucknowensis]
MNTEQLNRLLYGSKLRAYMLMRRTTYTLTIVAIGLLLYAHGVVTDPDTVQLIFYAIDAILGVFVVIYLLRILYGFERVKFLRRTWFEGALMAIILVNHVGTYLFDFPVIYNIFEGIGMPLSVEIYRVLVSLYMLLLLVIELLETRVHLKTLQVKPAVTFLMSFLTLISLGTAMFMLPKMTNDPDGMRFVDALFMATSASCITGLTVVDPGTYFTFSGQVILLLLVQLGGLGVMTFATFFATLMRQGIGIKQHVAMFEIMESESISFTKGLLRKLIIMTLSIEAIGAVIVFATWSNEVEFVGLGSKIFFSIFHAVSGFCNAGFSLFPEGLYSNPLQGAYVLHLTIAALVILGGIGFPTIIDVLSPRAMRARMDMPWRNWKMMTRVTVYSSAALLAFGTITFFLLEYFNTLSHLNFAEALITSFFQSATTRSSGFNTVDTSAISVPALLIMMMLMFIGASPGSMGGGIKTTTFTVIILSVWTTIVGKRNIEIGKRTIPHSVSYKAFAVFTFAVGFNILFLIILSISDAQFDILRLAFEQVSAFATVGLSTGITAGLSDVGKTVIILSMYIGRVGTLTLALAISTRATSTAYKYPDTHLAIG